MIYRLLGPLEVTRPDGRPIDLGPRKQRAVLAALLADSGRVVSTDRLIDVLWQGNAPSSAMASLQAYISNLRRALRVDPAAASVIVRQPPGYVLDIDDQHIDRAAFLTEAESARQHVQAAQWEQALTIADRALARVRGPFLEDLRDEHWVEVEAAAFEEVHTECRETRITALLAAGRVAPALVDAAALCHQYPLRDRTCWLRMLALHRAGRSTEALETYRDHAARLDDELGLDVGTELASLHTAILRHDPGLAAWPRQPGWSGAERLSIPASPAGPPESTELPAESTLIGRTTESDMIAGMLDQVRGGESRWLVLTGPAGIGKTRLAEECDRRTVAISGRSLWARCLEDDGTPAWWPIRQLLRQLGVDADGVLVPPARVEPDEARFAVYERVTTAIEDSVAEFGSGVTTLIVDDVQWADTTSLRCLMHLVAALHRYPVWFVLTLRENETGPEVRKLVDTVLHAAGNRHLTVTPLGPTDVDALARRVAGEDLDADEIHRLAERTGGNPLFVSEYARLPRDDRRGGEIPSAVRSVLDRRLHAVEPAVLQVLRVAAVIGDALDVGLLAVATGLTVDTLVDYLDDAADERIIVADPAGGGCVFAHGLLRDAVLHAIPALRKQRIHASVAEALIDSHDADRSSKRAQHLMAALPIVDPRIALSACTAAAREATERWSSETAARWWDGAVQAFDLLPASEQVPDERDDLLVARVEALARAGRGQTVLDVVDECLLDAVRQGRTSTVGRLAAALLRAAGAWPWVSYGRDPAPLLGRLAGMEQFVESDAAAHARLLAATAVGFCYHPDSSVPDALSRHAVDIASATGDFEVVADALLARILLFSGVAQRSEESLGLIRELFALPHRNSPFDNVIAHAVASMTEMNLGDVESATDHLGRGIAGCDLLRLPVVRVQLRWMEATLAAWHGDFDECRRQYDTARQIHLQTELYTAGSAGLAMNTLEWECGNLAAAEPGIVEPQSWSIAIDAASGRKAEATQSISNWLTASRPPTWTTLGHTTLLARVVADLELVQFAEQFVELLQPFTDRIATVGHVGSIGSVAEASARLHAVLGRKDRAAELLDRAEALATRTSSRPTLLRCRLLRAQLQPPSSARENAVSEILAEARRTGMLGLAAQFKNSPSAVGNSRPR
ncbi:BTAD domain-containing putative transcriptional regulator [Rhodococcoides fascians]|uniref:BTAD domain-containing putative transcriptional regulator n=1 Tax=Rhodococcoides fascians TaxID=1828 RepID=UPI000AB62197|nr:BTAD domain-containing putative transcriptional regulator [Rhodococcus fascians]